MSSSNLKWIFKNYYLNLTSKVNTSPIFILGNQKTGTSAITALLGEVTGERYTVDIFCFQGDLEKKLVDAKISFEEYVAKSKYYFSKKIIKEPSITFFYKNLHELFPRSDFVFIMRNPFDNVRSICNRLNVEGDFEGDFIPNYSLFYDWYYIADGEAFGHKGENFIHTQALRINAVYQIFKNADNMRLVFYEDFLYNKYSFIEHLAKDLGLDIVNENVDLDKQFQPKGQNIDANSFFSEKNHNIISSTCKEILKKYYPDVY